jgi:radical SAM superfamily enzyme with C-terminal helix-hairpin-helix motif
MIIRIIKGMNVPGKNGSALPVNPGEVVDVPDRFAKQEIFSGRAERVKDERVLERQEAPVIVKLKKR